MLRVRGAQGGGAVAVQIVGAAGAVSMLRFRRSTATKTMKRATSGEECTMLRGKWVAVFSGIVLAIAGCGHASAQATIKVAYTDPLSGPFAQVGDANLKQMQYIIDYINSKGGALGKKFELVPFDNKSQPSDALIALKSATDQNMPFIMQCSGSNIAAALIEAVNKHNDRNPENPIIYGNWGPDMNLLIKAGVDAGADLRYYTFYAHIAGGPTAIGAGGDNRVLAVMSFNENVAPEIGNAEAEAFTKGFRDKHKFDFSAAG